ncbi:hypothetical protein Bca52824_026406 [Brassica carinata]|uniref:Uncharacterized protein n=1 Tax=Brassica carinata TaxID=52824 RepID=A0A8X7SHX6_BRACI|nr:hypothetical protein Bca52824_026406 [Brassica carinata]
MLSRAPFISKEPNLKQSSFNDFLKITAPEITYSSLKTKAKAKILQLFFYSKNFKATVITNHTLYISIYIKMVLQSQIGFSGSRFAAWPSQYEHTSYSGVSVSLCLFDSQAVSFHNKLESFWDEPMVTVATSIIRRL